MKVVLQDGIKDCGVCSLLSIIRYYGGDVSKEYLREVTNTTRNGVSAYNLIEGARKVGFMATGMMGDLKKIEENNLPCLAHFVVNKNYKHFVAIYKIDFLKDKVLIMDPAKGRRVLSVAEVRLLSTNYFIFLKPVKKLPRMLKKEIIKVTIFKFVKDNKLYSVFLIVLTLSSFILQVLTAFLFKYLLEFAIKVHVSMNIYFIGYHLLILSCFKVWSNFFRNILLAKWMMIFDLELTLKTFEQILLLPYLYYKNRTTGEVITRLKDLGVVKNFLAQFFCFAITDFISFIVFFLLMIYISKVLGSLVFIIIFLLMMFHISRISKKRKMYQQLSQKEDAVNSYLVESLSNVDTIKGGHIEKLLADRFLLKYKKLLDKNYKYLFFNEMYQTIKNNIHEVLLVLVYGIGSYLVIREAIELGELFIFQTFFNYFLTSYYRILELVDSYPTFKVAMERIEDLYTIRAESFDGTYYFFAYDLVGEISIKNLNYNIGSRILFDEINLQIREKEKILLTGESGSGKSTFVKILMRYIEVPSGSVLINGIDINHYHLENLRKYITYVSSNEFLFTDTLRNNITLHKEIEDKDFCEVLRICRIPVIIHDDLKLLDMMVEENGFNFSNGERQRIILARMLLKKSSIYIFDEALGQIDIEMEKEILNDMFKFLKDKQVIVISHRLNNRNLFSRILKLENGKINEI